LRELARRQTDLNDRLKELQSALQAAKTPQAREEIERPLKRLRDQQQQILRDTDELREPLLRRDDRDARRGPAPRRGPEEADRPARRGEPPAPARPPRRRRAPAG